MSEIYVPVKPMDTTDPMRNPFARVNAVQVSASHMKGRGFYLRAFPAENRDNIVMLVVTSGQYKNLEPAARLNTKKVDRYQEQARREIEAREGTAWDLVLRVCDKCNLTPVQE